MLKTKPVKYHTANYQVLMEPELKQKLMEFRLFYEIDVPEHVRELLREWVKKVEMELNK